MTAYERLQRRGYKGSSIKDKMIYNGKYITDALLPDDPSYKERIEILGKGYINLRMNNRKLTQGTTPQMDIQASLDEQITFRLGDVFCHDGGHWLCVESYNLHDIYRTGKVEECNYLLKWQNPKTYEIIERWCSVRDPYASGLDENKVVTTGNAKYKIKMPRDGETALFHVDKRFLIDIANNEPIPYAIVKYDSVTNQYRDGSEGFLVINLKESQIYENDNRELMIADYKTPPEPCAPPVGSCDIIYAGEPTVKTGGSPKTFEARFYDGAGNILNAVEAAWELVLPPELTGKHITVVSETGNTIAIKAEMTAKIGCRFVLKMRADIETIETKRKISPEIFLLVSSGGSLSVYGYFEKEIEVKVGGLL